VTATPNSPRIATARRRRCMVADGARSATPEI
jgi:hypothetical protein